VWNEGDEVHSTWAILAGEDDGFLKFTLANGNTIFLRKTCIFKIEEGPS